MKRTMLVHALGMALVAAHRSYSQDVRDAHAAEFVPPETIKVAKPQSTVEQKRMQPRYIGMKARTRR